MDSLKLIRLLSLKTNRSEFTTLIIEIIRVRECLKYPAKASFYFRKSIEQQKDRIVELEREFETIRHEINSGSIDEIEIILEKQKQKIRCWKLKSEIHICDRIAISALQSGLNNLKSLIRLKKQFPYLKPLEHYLSQEEELLHLFD